MNEPKMNTKWIFHSESYWERIANYAIIFYITIKLTYKKWLLFSIGIHRISFQRFDRLKSSLEIYMNLYILFIQMNLFLYKNIWTMFFYLINYHWYTKIYHNHHILDWKRDLEPRAESDALDRKPTNGEQNKIFHSTHRADIEEKKLFSNSI